MADDPYSRLMWRLSDEYPDVWDDAHVLGTYVQLLIPADMAWPTRPHVPGVVDSDAYARLVECGLVLEEGKRYTIRGLDKERRKRRKAGRKGAAARWRKGDADPAAAEAADALANANAHANAHANGMPSRAKPSLDETSKDEKRRDKTSRAGDKKSRDDRPLQPLSEILQGRKA